MSRLLRQRFAGAATLPVGGAVLALAAVAFYGALGIRAGRTYPLTRRFADLAVVYGLVLLSVSLARCAALRSRLPRRVDAGRRLAPGGLRGRLSGR